MEPDLMILEKLIAVAIWLRRTLVLLICCMEGNLGNLLWIYLFSSVKWWKFMHQKNTSFFPSFRCSLWCIVACLCLSLSLPYLTAMDLRLLICLCVS